MIKNNGGIYIIAEIGGNHEGDFGKAKELLIDAAESGVDAVKFQVYTGDTLVNYKVDPKRVSHFNKFALSTEQYLELAVLCNHYKVDFLASVWNQDQISLFAEKMPFIKVGSGDLTAYQILKKITETGKPILLSTGLSTLDEIVASVEYIYKCNSVYRNKDMLGLLQCTSMYPIPDADANLSVIRTFQDLFPNSVIGYSDHTVGTYAAELAVALGARVLELHFTDNKENREFRDHQVSFTSDDIKNLSTKINSIIDLLGDGVKKPMKSEIETGHINSFRRGLYAKEDLSQGAVITDDSIISLRPSINVQANEYENVIGKKVQRRITVMDEIELSSISDCHTSCVKLGKD